MQKSNPVVWFELYVQDMARAQAFYETVLALKLEALPIPEGDESGLQMRAFPMEMENGGAGGALVKAHGCASGGTGTLIYFGCEDCAVEAGRVEAAGGTLSRGKMSIGQYGFCAIAVDTEGNTFGLHSMQ